MTVSVVCVGKLKESFWREACGEYIKRLGAFGKIEVIEVAEEKSDTLASVEVEGCRLLGKINPKAYKIALAIDGKSKSSEVLSMDMKKLFDGGVSHITFVIGGSHGLSDGVNKACDERLSFSEMTFPHQMMRVILLEQIYRAFKIMAGEPYHK